MSITKSQKIPSFAFGAALLAISAVIVKLIGVCYKIPLVHLLGAQGMGYFNAAYDVYALLCVISTTGLPVAVSVLVNRYPACQKSIFRVSLILFTVIGLPGTLAVFFGAEKIALWIGAPNAAQSLRFIAPSVLFICLSGAFRGYYQAKRNMVPTAVSQVIEAAGKLLFGLVFARIAIGMNGGTATAASFAVLGLSVGTLLSLLYLVICGRRPQKEESMGTISHRQLLSQLLAVAFPVTLGAVLAGFSKVIDLALIMRRLQDGGISQDAAIALYGCYSSMVIPLFNVVPTLFGSLAMSLVPHLSHAIAGKDTAAQTQILSTAFRWGVAISLPAAIGMGMLSKQILDLLFSGTNEIRTAVPLLVPLCMAVPASCLITATSAVLQAYGYAWIPMISTAIGCAIKAASLYVLCVNPRIGVLAAPISTLLCCTATACLNFAFVAKYTPEFDFAKQLLRSIAAAAIAVGAAAVLHKMLQLRFESSLINVFVPIVTAVVMYIPIALKCGLIRISDIQSILKK